MDIRIREGTPADAQICGRICYNAFKTISEAHGFAPDFPAPEVAIGLLTWMLAHPEFYSVVAEIDGRIVGSNFWTKETRSQVLGPIAVDPTGRIAPFVPSRFAGIWARRSLASRWRRCCCSSSGFITPPSVTLTRGTSVQISGTQFNGLSVGSDYGDDCTNATNHPIVRLTNGATRHVLYARTYDHSTMGIATGNTIVSTTMDIPANMETGSTRIEVIANGIPSRPRQVTVQ